MPASFQYDCYPACVNGESPGKAGIRANAQALMAGVDKGNEHPTSSRPNSPVQTNVQPCRAKSTRHFKGLATYNPQSGVPKGILPRRNVRSKCRCSCPAVHTMTRSLLRPSSTHEPSDPPPRVNITLTHSGRCRSASRWPEKLPVTEAPLQSYTGLRIFRSQLHHISEAPHSLA
jgi:hypothetical protein